MNWLTVRLIMRIADIVVAATTIAGRRQFFSRPGLAPAELANEVRLGQGFFDRGRAQLYQRTGSSAARSARSASGPAA